MGGKRITLLGIAASQLGWLDAVPAMVASDGKTHRWDYNRRTHLEKSKRGEVVEVYVGDAEYLLTAMMEAGPYSIALNGDKIKITWADLNAYIEATEAVSSVREKRMIRTLSEFYLRGLAQGTNVAGISPIELAKETIAELS